MGTSEIIEIWSICVNAILSISAIVLSVIVFLKTNKDNKSNLEIALFSNINDTKMNLDNVIYDASKISKRSLRRLSIDIDPLIEDYLNSLNIGCSLYLNNDINKTRFKTMYQTDIVIVCESECYKDIIMQNKDSYHSLLKVYDEWKN